MSSFKPLSFLVAAAALTALAACSTNTVQGVKQDAHLSLIHI